MNRIEVITPTSQQNRKASLDEIVRNVKHRENVFVLTYDGTDPSKIQVYIRSAEGARIEVAKLTAYVLGKLLEQEIKTNI